MLIKNRDELIRLRKKYSNSLAAEKKKILVCAGTGCVSSGSLDIFNRLSSIMRERNIPCSVELQEEPHEDGARFEKSVGLKKSGCHGFCQMGPLIRIEPEGYLYTKVKLSDCEEIIEKTILGGQHIEKLAYKKDDNVYKDDEYKEQHKDYYIKDIHEDIVYTRKVFKKIKNKYFINNRPVDQVVDDLLIIIQNISTEKTIE